MKIVILAGGSGIRLWPLSREKKPKQVVAPFGKLTLLRQTHDRAKKIVKQKDIFVVCGTNEKEVVTKEARGIPPENIFIEPMRRGTAAAITLAMQKIAKTYPDEAVAVISSDAYISDVENFKKTLESAGRAVMENSKHLVLIGVKPGYFETGYDYIAQGEHVWTDPDAKQKYFAVYRFIPRTEADTTEQKLREGSVLWNTGIFIARAQHFLSLIERHMPKLFSLFKKKHSEIKHGYSLLPTVSIDSGVMEKETRLLVVPATFDWIDVGTWRSVASTMNSRKMGEGKDFVGVCEKNNTVIALNKKKMFAIVGVDDLVVVDTPDVLLITNREQSHKVRDIIALLKKHKKYGNYL